MQAEQTFVPFLDLGPTHASLKAGILEDLANLIDAGAFVNGPPVAEFEAAFAAYCDAEHCVGVASGLDALRLGLLALGLQPGDRVIVPALTFVATLEAVTQAGGVPVPVDVSEDDYGLDPDATAAALEGDVRVILPVHLYGQLADVARLRALADGRGIQMLEDACQAHGAVRATSRAGSRGSAAFSFYPGKNLGAMGDAGALTTGDAGVAARVRALREHGQVAKYRHEFEGYTSRLDVFQALVLLRKLAHLDEWNAQRSSIAAFYTEHLAGIEGLRLPSVAQESEPVWHLYVVRVERPVELQEFLMARGIGTGRHYPDPVHLTPPYERLGYRLGSFPVAEQIARECISLPIFPGMTEQQLEAVVDGVRAYFDRG